MTKPTKKWKSPTAPKRIKRKKQVQVMTDEVSDERKDEEGKEAENKPDTPMLHEPTHPSRY
jgi:hypothetical protein